MMVAQFVFGVVVVFVFLFGFVIFFGAPYLPTLKKQQRIMRELVEPQKNQKFLELGSGDGTVMVYLAKHQISVVGIELNPLLYVFSYLRLLPYRKYAKVKWGNFWKVSFSDYDVLYVFLQDKFMEKLDKKIVAEIKKPIVVASFTFKIPNKEPIAERQGIFIYTYRP